MTSDRTRNCCQIHTLTAGYDKGARRPRQRKYSRATARHGSRCSDDVNDPGFREVAQRSTRIADSDHEAPIAIHNLVLKPWDGLPRTRNEVRRPRSQDRGSQLLKRVYRGKLHASETGLRQTEDERIAPSGETAWQSDRKKDHRSSRANITAPSAQTQRASTPPAPTAKANLTSIMERILFRPARLAQGPGAIIHFMIWAAGAGRARATRDRHPHP